MQVEDELGADRGGQHHVGVVGGRADRGYGVPVDVTAFDEPADDQSPGVDAGSGQGGVHGQRVRAQRRRRNGECAHTRQRYDGAEARDVQQRAAAAFEHAGQHHRGEVDGGTDEGSERGEVVVVLGLATAFLAATSAFAQLERGANRIYGTERDRPALRKYTRAAVLTATARSRTTRRPNM